MADLNSTLVRGNLRVTSDTNINGNVQASTFNSYPLSGSIGANTIPIRDSNGYVYFNYINTNVSQENPSSYSGVSLLFTGSDGWIRKSSPSNVSVGYATSAGSASSATTASSADYATSAGDSSKLNGQSASYYVAANSAITGATKCKITYDSKGLVTAGANLVASDIPDLSGTYVPFSSANRTTVDGTNNTPKFFDLENNNLISGYGSYWYIINLGHYSGNNYASQIAMNYQDSIGDTDMFIRTANDTTWREWRRVIHSGNIGSQSVNYATSAGSATSATSAGNADTTDGLHVHSGRNNEANKIVRTDGNGYLQCGYINSNSGDENNSSAPARIWGTNGSDSYLRTYNAAYVSVGYATSAGSASTATSATTASSADYATSAGSVAWANVSNHPTALSDFTNDIISVSGNKLVIA